MGVLAEEKGVEDFIGLLNEEEAGEDEGIGVWSGFTTDEDADDDDGRCTTTPLPPPGDDGRDRVGDD